MEADNANGSVLNQFLDMSIAVVVTGSNDYINNYLLLGLYGSRHNYTAQDFSNLPVNSYVRQILGELKKEWETSKSGKMQSPIDLSNHRVRVVPKLGELKKYYKP
ncbi:hypothetical protein JHK82_027734 [Glycine max]|nr:hypothetical protein JHK82_027734 [Glycine max]